MKNLIIVVLITMLINASAFAEASICEHAYEETAIFWCACEEPQQWGEVCVKCGEIRNVETYYMDVPHYYPNDSTICPDCGIDLDGIQQRCNSTNLLLGHEVDHTYQAYSDSSEYRLTSYEAVHHVFTTCEDCDTQFISLSTEPHSWVEEDGMKKCNLCGYIAIQGY